MNQMRTILVLTFALCIASQFSQAQTSASAKYRWTRLGTTYGDLEIPNKGKFQTGSVIADFNKDGKDDFVIVEKTESPSVVMYIHSQGRTWVKYVVEQRKIPAGEAVALYDIDGDGDLDLAVGSEESNQIWWWENPFPAINPGKGWKRFYIKKSGVVFHHDMAFGDFNGDGKVELAFWNQGENALFVASQPENLTKADEWKLTKIFSYENDCQMLQRSNGTELKNHAVNTHLGMCVADINLDGKDDIVAGGMYFNYQNGHYFQHDIDKSYIATKVAVGQLIEDGRPEVVMVSGDGEGPLVMYTYEKGSWIPTILQKETRRAHSLQIIDFDSDGYPDIFWAEMKTKEIDDPKIVLLINDIHNNFERIEVANGFGSHNSGVGDFDGDGDFDIIGKPYGWDTPRLDLWINEGKK
jgi:hypothetical protein